MATNRGENEPDHGQYDTAGEVFGVCAAAALYRRAMLDDVRVDDDYFDSTFFAYYEDVDLDWRARLRGWKAHYVPTAVAEHDRGTRVTSGGRSALAIRHSLKNRYLMMVRNDRPADALRCSGVILVTEVLRFVNYGVSRSAALTLAMSRCCGACPTPWRRAGRFSGAASLTVRRSGDGSSPIPFAESSAAGCGRDDAPTLRQRDAPAARQARRATSRGAPQGTSSRYLATTLPGSPSASRRPRTEETRTVAHALDRQAARGTPTGAWCRDAALLPCASRHFCWKCASPTAEYLVDQEYVGLQVDGDGEPEPDVHPRGVVLDRELDELSQFREASDCLADPVGFRPDIP